MCVLKCEQLKCVMRCCVRGGKSDVCEGKEGYLWQLSCVVVVLCTCVATLAWKSITVHAIPLSPLRMYWTCSVTLSCYKGFVELGYKCVLAYK